jgi:chromosomal replication initiation ATPase DnaA
MTLIEQLFNELESGAMRIAPEVKEKYLEREQIESHRIKEIMGISIDQKKVTIKNIFDVVASICDVEKEAMKSRDRHHKVSFARQIFMYLASELTEHSDTVISAYVKRDRVMVGYSRSTIPSAKQYGTEWERRCIAECEEILTLKTPH